VELGDPPGRPYENRYPSRTIVAVGPPLLYYAPIGGNNNKLPGLLFAANLHLKELKRAETVDMEYALNPHPALTLPGRCIKIVLWSNFCQRAQLAALSSNQAGGFKAGGKPVCYSSAGLIYSADGILAREV
jgi:hypothetical protein